jgi:3-oxoacyl-[acyl-carrier-protein] synthase III
VIDQVASPSAAANAAGVTALGHVLHSRLATNAEREMLVEVASETIREVHGVRRLDRWPT